MLVIVDKWRNQLYFLSQTIKSTVENPYIFPIHSYVKDNSPLEDNFPPNDEVSLVHVLKSLAAIERRANPLAPDQNYRYEELVALCTGMLYLIDSNRSPSEY